MSESTFSECLATLSRFFVGDGTLDETLLRVAELTTEAIPAASLVGITLMVEGKPRTAVFTDETAPQIDQSQYDTGDGPCLDAFREQQVFSIACTEDEGPWPTFRAAAAGHGIHSTLSLPLVVDRASVGAMNLYADRADAFGPDDHETAATFASHAAIVLANAQAYWDASSLSERLGEAMRSRAVIERAKGMLMAAQGCDEDRAFELLVQASQRENVKLRDIARRIVTSATRRPPPAPR
jgi:GAF domain-containing protein